MKRRLSTLLRLEVFCSTSLPIWAALCALLAAVIVGGMRLGIPWKHMMGDPAVVAGWPVYLGSVSIIGGLLWAAAASIFLFAFYVQRGRCADTQISGFLLSSGVFVAVLGVDDMFMLHDVVFPRYLSIGQPLVVAGYAVLALLYFVRFAPVLARTAYPVLLAAMAMLAASAALDQMQDLFAVAFPGIDFCEDAVKLLGIGTWLSYAIHACGVALGREPASARTASQEETPAARRAGLRST